MLNQEMIILLTAAVFSVMGLAILLLDFKRRKKILRRLWLPMGSKRITATHLWRIIYFSAACSLIFFVFDVALGKNLEIVHTAYVTFNVDASKSQAAERPLGSKNRLDRSEDIIKAVCDVFPDIHTSLYAFTEIARSHAYFSESSGNRHNCGYIEKTLDNVLRIESPSKKGSNIADAILMASSSFPKEAKSRVMILLTDGEYTNPDKEFVQAFSAIKKRGIVLLVVGVGEENGAYIPIYNGEGEIADVERGGRGAKIITALRSETLRTIAKEVNGKYFGENQREKLLAEINENLVEEKEELQTFYSSWKVIFLVSGFSLAGLLFFKSVL